MPDHSTDRPAPVYIAPQQGVATIPLPQDIEPRHDAELAAERNAVPATAASPLVATRQEIVTADGFELGKVKEVTETHFKVDAPMKGDYWLAADDVAEMRGQLVVLNFNETDLDAHALAEPAPADTLLSVSQQQDQRVRMEAELEGQRAGLARRN